MTLFPVTLSDSNYPKQLHVWGTGGFSLGKVGAMPPRRQDPWLLYCYVRLDSRRLRRLGPIWPTPTLQCRSANCIGNPFPLLQQLRWLPIEGKIFYKLCILMHRVHALTYLAELRDICSNERLRSASRHDYSTP